MTQLVQVQLVIPEKLLLSFQDGYVRALGHVYQGLRVLNQQFHVLVLVVVATQLIFVVRIL